MVRFFFGLSLIGFLLAVVAVANAKAPHSQVETLGEKVDRLRGRPEATGDSKSMLSQQYFLAVPVGVSHFKETGIEADCDEIPSVVQQLHVTLRAVEDSPELGTD